MSALNLFDRVLGGVVLGCNALGSAWTFVIMLAIVLDILGRFLFNAPISGTTELVTMSVVILLYLQLANTLRSGTMTRSDAMLTILLQRRPRIGHFISLVCSCAGAALMGAIMVGAWPKWLLALHEGFYVGIQGVFAFPDWPRLLIVFVGCGLTELQFVILAIRNFQGLLNPGQAGPRAGGA